MPLLLNRFPLLGLWAREAAIRVGHPPRDADVIGHAVAVLYAIRADFPIKTDVKYRDKDAEAAALQVKEESPEITRLTFGGDTFPVSRTASGDLVGRVGSGEPQTAQSYRYKVASKFPAGSYERLRKAFADLLAEVAPQDVDAGLVYPIYDRWKKECADGRMVDLDRLAAWCEENTRKRRAESAAPAG